MKNIYSFIFLFCGLISSLHLMGQTCTGLQVSYTSYESRCAATGSIKVTVSGGSGDYKFKVTGPVTINFTTSDSITGLSAGTYLLEVADILNNCSISIPNVIVDGNYQDPRFSLSKTDVTCEYGSNGSITVDSILNGRPPFTFEIVAPSSAGIGQNNQTGVFQNLPSGLYSIQMKDSCGGIQTRQITLNDYYWWIDAYPFTRTNCNQVSGFIRVWDNLGNNSMAAPGIPGFMYGITATLGDTTWSASPVFSFTLPPGAPFEIIVKDACGKIKKVMLSVNNIPSLAANVQTTDLACSTFSANVSNAQNFYNPSFCLYDENDVQLECNTSGYFTGLAYGSYCIKAHDECTDSTITRCFTVLKPMPVLEDTIRVTNLACSTFTASLHGSSLYNASYCLYDTAHVQLVCNDTGIFTGLPYGSYCIETYAPCYDTTISRCFTVLRPIPTFGDFTINYIDCSLVNVSTSPNDTLFEPQYCIYDSIGVLITCNTTGVFDSIPIGQYCITAYDACFDTTFRSCITIPKMVVTNDLAVNISNQTCTRFTATITSALANGNFCLYDTSGNVLECNTTGVFTGLGYNSYCVIANVTCPDTSFQICFNAGPPIPSVRATVQINKLTCTGFKVSVVEQQNLTNPRFCLYDHNDTLLYCNTNGVFVNVPYGDYCIRIKDGCYDTTITRCFSKYPTRMNISGFSGKSCVMGMANLNISVAGDYAPYYVEVFTPQNTLLVGSVFAGPGIFLDNIPGIADTLLYKIVVKDACDNKDSIYLATPGSYFKTDMHSVSKCPGATSSQGSGDIVCTVSTNMGIPYVTLFEKDGIPYVPEKMPDMQTGNTFYFYDMAPGIYIIKSQENICWIPKYDTVVIHPYSYPSLQNSSVFQCDVSGFSVTARVSNGVGPFMYEIIGSTPSTPVIITGPQASPIFPINNGANYSLIRLRATDACGNATLGDASVLPLALTGITVVGNCLNYPTTLYADPIYGATYAWYKKASMSATDSVYLGSSSSYYIPLTSVGDLGTYVCHLSVNEGCIKRDYYFNMDGSCYIILPVKLLHFTGKTQEGKNILNWQAEQEGSTKSYIIERSNGGNAYQAMGHVLSIKDGADRHEYMFTDPAPQDRLNLYRLKIIDQANQFKYSSIVVLQNDKNQTVSLYPNPAKESFNLVFNNEGTTRYKIVVSTLSGQRISEQFIYTVPGTIFNYKRLPGMQNGIYLVSIQNMQTKELITHRLVFL